MLGEVEGLLHVQKCLLPKGSNDRVKSKKSVTAILVSF